MPSMPSARKRVASDGSMLLLRRTPERCCPMRCTSSLAGTPSSGASLSATSAVFRRVDA